MKVTQPHSMTVTQRSLRGVLFLFFYYVACGLVAALLLLDCGYQSGIMTVQAQTIYIRNCSTVETTGECSVTQVSNGCYYTGGHSIFYANMACQPAAPSPPTDISDYCVFQTKYDQPDCSGPPTLGQELTLVSPCFYCDEDFGGGTQGIETSCNSTGYFIGICEDFACGICPRYSYLPFHTCVDGVIYDALPCPALYSEQLYEFSVCGNSNDASSRVQLYSSPFVSGNLTISCLPLL